MILNSLQNGPFVWPTVVKEDGTTRTKRYEELLIAEKLQADCDLKATNIILQGLPSDVYAIVNHHKVTKEIWDRVKILMQGTKLSLQENECKLYDEFDKFSLVKGETLYHLPSEWRDDPIACLHKAMAFLTVVASSRVTVQQVQRRQGQSYAGTSYKGNATSSGGNNVGGQTKVVKCYNCQGEGHMARKCTQPKRPRNAAWFKQKDKTEDLDAYDSDCDDVSNAKAVLMANLSNYGSDVISEVPYSEPYHNDMDNQSVQAMQGFEQTPVVDFTDNEITNLGYQNPFYLKKAQRIKPTLYDGSVISSQHAASPVIDDEETLILEEVSRSKMLAKQNDPMSKEKKVNTTLINYVELNRLFEDFGKRFVPQQELSDEQAFWLQTSHPNTDQSASFPVKIEAPRELPKMEASVQQYSLDKQCFEIVKKELFLENDRLLQQIMSQDVLYSVMNSTTLNGESVNLSMQRSESCDKCFDLDAELLKSQNAYNDLSKKYFKNNDLKAQLQAKDTTIWKETVETVAQIPIATIVAPGMFKLDLDPLALRLLQNREAHIYYLKHTQEQADILQGIVESSKTSDSNTPVLSSIGLKCSTSTCRSQPTESECSKHMTGNRSQLMNFLGNIIVSRVYYVKGLGHNLVSVGQFYDADLEVAFWKNTCFIWNLEGVDLLSGSTDINLYTIYLDDMLKTSLICLLSKALKTKSWLWHRRLSHLNFSTLNKLAKDSLARGIPKIKFKKDHLCSACALGKIKKSSHQPKPEDTNQEKLYLLHIDVYGPMRVESINGKKYILVIVDDYSRFTWVKFLRSMDEPIDAIIKCIKNIQVRLNVTVRNVRTDNGTEFVNQTLRKFYENVEIMHQTSVTRTPQ
ncbi:retrovirus-related pol polyprotein from transposon TNT 1-94 [Tanacetum coccineum]